MTTPIQGLASSPLTLPSAPSGMDRAAGTASFKDFLMDSLNEVNTMQLDANKAVEALATGQDVSPGEVMTAVQKADLAFRMMMQIRNKLVSAYEDVQNIRV